MKRKGLLIVVLTMLLCMFSLCFVACSDSNNANGDNTPHEHDYKIQTSETMHWLKCDCGDTKDFNSHSGGIATCVKKAECSTCGVFYGELGDHNYGEWKTNYNSTHSKVCINEASHVVTEDCRGGIATEEERAICEVCNVQHGAPLKHKHNFNKQEVKDIYLSKQATCTERAEYYYSCLCGEKGSATFESGEPLNHSYGEWVSNGNNTHTKTCSNDNNHKITENCNGGTATCTTKAVCENCNTSYGQLEPHVFDKEVVEEKYIKARATCTEKAEYYYSCKCGEKGSETFESGEPLEHNYGEWVSNGNNTHTKTCSNDNNHKITENCSGGTATCATKAVCDECKTFYGKLEPHVFDKEVVEDKYLKSEATCKEKAKYYYSCSCGKKGNTTFETGDIEEHEYKIQTSETMHWLKCDCGDTKDFNVHSGGTATCVSKSKCDVCGVQYGELGEHSYGDWISNGNNTHTKTCSNDNSHKITNDCVGGTATCIERAKCNTCNGDHGGFGQHNYSEWKPNYDGTHSKICSHSASHIITEDCTFNGKFCVTCRFEKEPITITLHFNRGGVQSAWFYDVVERFEQANKDKPYGNKTGVYVDWSEGTVTNLTSMKTAGTNIYMAGGGSLDKYIRDGSVMDISDVVTSVNPYDGKTIESKLSDNKSHFYKDGSYYALPWKEYFIGTTHNVDIFEEYGLYFADTTTGNPYKGNVGYNGKPCYFIAENPFAEKTAGVDGIKGTYDDGLPTSLEELMALCHKIKDLGSDWFPFACTGGNHEDYTNYLTEAILIGLEGSERFGNYKDCDGEMEIVTGYTSEKLWGLDDVYVPTTTTARVDKTDKSTWINISKSVNRYYAIAFIKYLEKNLMICDCIRNPGSSNISVQENFIFSDTYMNDCTHHSAMIMEGSHWYTESEHNWNFDKWDNYMMEERPEFGIMPYPAAVDGHVEGVETSLAYLTSDATIVINNNLMADYENNKYVIEACKDFLYFFYSDQEIANYIEATGQNRSKTNFDWQSLVYEKDENGNYKNGLDGTERVIKADCKIPNYQITVLELERDSILLDLEPTEYNPTSFIKLSTTSAIMSPGGGAFYSVFKNGDMTVREAFEATIIRGE